MLTVEAVQCAVCKKLHLADSDTYFRFHGNVYIGRTGGVIGNNFPQQDINCMPEALDRLISSTYVCREGTCLSKIMCYRSLTYLNPTAVERS